MKPPPGRLALLALGLCLAWSQGAAAQERPNALYLELGGAGVGVTANYERMLVSKLSLRLGGGVYPDEVARGAFVAVADVVLGGQRHQFFAGAGVAGVQTATPAAPMEWVLATELGYRYRARSGFLFRAGVAFFPGEVAEGSGWAWPGVSLGWSF